MRAHYGKVSGVQNYIALIGKKRDDLEESVGYYGERIALKAQMLGLNTCWVTMSFSKGAAKKGSTIQKGEKLACALSLGYGATQGEAHQSKSIVAVTRLAGAMPDWFKKGVEAAPYSDESTEVCI